MDDSFIRGNSQGISRIGGENAELVHGEASSDSNKQFCAIDYFDHEGERVIKHAFLSVAEKLQLMEESIKNKIQIKIYDLSPSAVYSE
jgi:hypothetical protein